jgi:hypothetical protein
MGLYTRHENEDDSERNPLLFDGLESKRPPLGHNRLVSEKKTD